MTRTEPVAAFSVTGAVVGVLAWAGARYAPGVDLPDEVMVPLVAGIVACVSGLARQWVVPHAQHVSVLKAADKLAEVAERAARGNRHQSETPPPAKVGKAKPVSRRDETCDMAGCSRPPVAGDGTRVACAEHRGILEVRRETPRPKPGVRA